MGSAVVVESLSKSYGEVRAVDDVSFAIEEGEIFALLGPNGAGKTTVVEILEGHRERSAGRVSVLGFDPATGGRDFRERIGIVLQEAGFEEEFTVSELLRLHAGLYPRHYQPDDMIDMVGLAEKNSARVKSLSGGQRRRLDLALGLIGAPQVLFLDEPTTGFDPSARRKAWELVAGLRNLGTTVVLTTHYMEEAQHLADRVAVLRQGRLVALGHPDQLGRRDRRLASVEFRLPQGVDLEDLPVLAGQGEIHGRVVCIRTDSAVEDVHTLTEWALATGVDLAALSLTRPTLEDVYLELTGEGVRP